ncbi:MAG: hypothetical protein ABI689_02255 [Thermoanaerobaculia bacterium]
MAALTQQQLAAAEEFADATLDELETAEGVHPETAVAAVAGMAGSFLLRSFGFELEALAPGTVVLSDEANLQGTRLIQILGGVLAHGGVELDREILSRGPDPDRQPRLDFFARQAALEAAFVAVGARQKLALREAAEAAAAATGFLIQQFAEELDPSVAFGIAVYGFIEGAKTVPGPATH